MTFFYTCKKLTKLLKVSMKSDDNIVSKNANPTGFILGFHTFFILEQLYFELSPGPPGRQWLRMGGFYH